MPRKPAAPALIAGPYAPPKCKAGRPLACRLRGDVIVAGLTDAPIAWPYTAGVGGQRKLILCGDLERAVQTESVQALCHHWGVSRWLVQDWRRALGVGRFTEGTTELWRRLAPSRLDTEARRKGQAAAVEARRKADG